MIICRTPFRISYFGGGTDYPDWYRAHGGAVLATTIDKYSYFSSRPHFNHRLRPNDEMDIDSLILPPSRMTEPRSHLLLVYTGIARTASEITAEAS